MAMILAIVMGPALFYQPDQPSKEPIMPKASRELVLSYREHATDKILLVGIGTEERLKKDGFLKTDHRFFFFGRKYEMVKEPKSYYPQVKIVHIGQRLALKPGQKLKVLIGRSGELKKGSDYQVEKIQDTTFIIVTNKVKGGAVLAVVEAKN